MSVVAYAKEDYKKAIEFLLKALNFNADYFPAWNNMANFFRQMKKSEMVTETLEKAAEVNPDNYNLWVLWGQNYFEARKFDKAIDSFKHLVEIDPKIIILGTFWVDYVRLKKIRKK